MGEVMRVVQDAPSDEALERAQQVLEAQGVLVMPTDSVYGIGCVATDDNPAYERIFAIKRRDRAQVLPWLVAEVDDLARLGRNVSSEALALARAFWPGAFTIVVEASDEVPSGYQSADGTIALRMPDSILVRELARRAGPLAVTSANTHGAPTPASFDELERAIVDAADVTLDGGACPGGTSSTIVSCVGGALAILREGPITAEDIARVRLYRLVDDAEHDIEKGQMRDAWESMREARERLT